MKRMSRSLVCFSFITVAAVYFAGPLCLAADAPKDDSKTDAAKTDLKVIKPDEAKDYEGQDVVVEFDVVSSRELSSGLCFLNSMSDFNDPNAFTALISPTGLGKFKEDPKTEKPANYFRLKKIRVTGKVVVYQRDKDSPKKYEIKVDDPAQIKIVEEAAPDVEKK